MNIKSTFGPAPTYALPADALADINAERLPKNYAVINGVMYDFAAFAGFVVKTDLKNGDTIVQLGFRLHKSPDMWEAVSNIQKQAVDQAKADNGI